MLPNPRRQQSIKIVHEEVTQSKVGEHSPRSITDIEPGMSPNSPRPASQRIGGAECDGGEWELRRDDVSGRLVYYNTNDHRWSYSLKQKHVKRVHADPPSTHVRSKSVVAFGTNDGLSRERSRVLGERRKSTPEQAIAGAPPIAVPALSKVRRSRRRTQWEVHYDAASKREFYYSSKHRRSSWTTDGKDLCWMRDHLTSQQTLWEAHNDQGTQPNLNNSSDARRSSWTLGAGHTKDHYGLITGTSLSEKSEDRALLEETRREEDVEAQEHEERLEKGPENDHNAARNHGEDRQAQRHSRSPSIWEVHKDPQGLEYFYSPKHRRSSWNRPVGKSVILPPAPLAISINSVYSDEPQLAVVDDGPVAGLVAARTGLLRSEVSPRTAVYLGCDGDNVDNECFVVVLSQGFLDVYDVFDNLSVVKHGVGFERREKRSFMRFGEVSQHGATGGCEGEADVAVCGRWAVVATGRRVTVFDAHSWEVLRAFERRAELRRSQLPRSTRVVSLCATAFAILSDHAVEIVSMPEDSTPEEWSCHAAARFYTDLRARDFWERYLARNNVVHDACVCTVGEGAGGEAPRALLVAAMEADLMIFDVCALVGRQNGNRVITPSLILHGSRDSGTMKGVMTPGKHFSFITRLTFGSGKLFASGIAPNNVGGCCLVWDVASTAVHADMDVKSLMNTDSEPDDIFLTLSGVGAASGYKDARIDCMNTVEDGSVLVVAVGTADGGAEVTLSTWHIVTDTGGRKFGAAPIVIPIRVLDHSTFPEKFRPWNSATTVQSRCSSAPSTTLRLSEGRRRVASGQCYTSYNHALRCYQSYLTREGVLDPESFRARSERVYALAACGGGKIAVVDDTSTLRIWGAPKENGGL